MKRIAAVALALLLVAAIGDEQPCDRYVDYMCACHDDDPEFDCEDLRDVYADADPSLQDSCAVELAEQREEDEQAGLDCEVGTADSGL